MIVLSIVLIIIGLLVAGLSVLIPIGIILLIIGLILNLTSANGHRWY